jgi:hypothetical protein
MNRMQQYSTQPVDTSPELACFGYSHRVTGRTRCERVNLA